jgi:hypothetical protein
MSGNSSRSVWNSRRARTSSRLGQGHGGGTGSAVQQGDLADDLASSDLVDPLAIAHHFGPALHQDEHLPSQLALGREDAAVGQVDHVGEGRDALQLVLAEPGEERDRAQQVDFFVASHVGASVFACRSPAGSIPPGRCGR